MRICTAQQMAAIDRETIAGGVPAERLMERAGGEITAGILRYFERHGFRPPEEALVVCGKGNNGGDGLVIARLLAEQDWGVTVMLLAPVAKLSDEARLNYDRLPPAVAVVSAAPEDWVAEFRQLVSEVSVVVDAVFGTGIKTPLRGAYVELFGALNDAASTVVAVDIPSGVAADDGAVDPVAVRADLTVTVGLPKLGLLLPPGRDHAGAIEVVDIGFADELCARHAPDWHFHTLAEYRDWLPLRSTATHKYRCGHLLAIAGSRAYSGAAVLTGLGALRSGVGLVTMAVPVSIETPVRSTLIEAIVAPLAETAAATIAPVDEAVLDRLLERKNAVAIGPGLDSDPISDAHVVDLARKLAQPLVIDADGLSAFARLGVEPTFSSGQVVLTPHAGELGRLLGLPSAAVVEQQWQLVPELARRWQVTLLLKGSPTLIADPDGRLHVNPSGDDALAHGGTGDVLTGLIGGLLAQGVGASRAALLGAYLHGLAGHLASRDSASRSVLAREVAHQIGAAIAYLEESDARPWH